MNVVDDVQSCDCTAASASAVNVESVVALGQCYHILL